MDTFMTIAFAFGFCITCIYKIGISVGSEQLKDAPAKLVTFLLVCVTVGSSLGPAASSFVVGLLGTGSAMVITFALYAAVFVLFCLLLILEKKLGAKA